MELSEFAHQLNCEVHDRVASGADDGPFSEQVFTGLVLEYLAEIGMVDEATLCHVDSPFKNSIVRLNAFAFSEEHDCLDLIVTVFRDNPKPTIMPKELLANAANQGLRFFKAVMNGNFASQLEPSHPAFALSQAIQNRKKSIIAVRVFVITDGLAREKKLKTVEDDCVKVTLEIIDIERLYRGMQAGLPRDEIEVDFVSLVGHPIPCVCVPESDRGEYSACLAVFPGNVLATLYEQYGARLLELNVRSFLSTTGKINKGIRNTLNTRPDRFVAYNNGVVITVDEMVMERTADGQAGIRFVKGMQIVNGGQTTASLHRARKIDKTDLDNVFVPAKITKIRPDKITEMVSMISRFANSQNTVQPADFSANDPFHVHVEKLACSIWCPDQQGRWFYERARGSYQVALFRDGDTPARLKKLKEMLPPQRRFSKPELAKYIHAWDQKPHLVSMGSQKNFDVFMQAMRKQRSAHWLPDEAWYRDLIAKTILFREVQRQVQRLFRDETIKAQPVNVSTYLVSYLALRSYAQLDLALIWKQQTLSCGFVNLIVKWAVGIDSVLRESAEGKMVSEWAKKEACWQKVKNSDLTLTTIFPEWPADRVSASAVIL